MAKRKTNVQVVKQMMEYSAHGPLAQMFIMQAIEKYANACASADPALFENGLINGAAWVATAKEIQATLTAHYK